MESEINTARPESRQSASWCSWTKHSEDALCNVEKKILSCLKTQYKCYYVDIGPVVGKDDRVWTICMNQESSKIPLVLIHGMASGSALWCPNLDALAADRPVYAIDLLGFAHSSRPKFSSDAVKAEAQWVESVEEWRREVNLGQFVLLGHSLGGYIATAYAIKYPERVRHLILADAWGYPERPPKELEKPRPLWVRPIIAAMQTFNPLFAIRAAGPAGLWLVSKTRPDIPRKYMQYLPDAESIVPEYIYQCNAQPPSGETVFLSLTTGLAYAKYPMLYRIDKLHPAVPMTYITGSKTWVLGCKPEELVERRPRDNVYTKVIEGAGHHIYLDIPEEFNKYVIEACEKADVHNPDIKPQDVTNGSTENIFNKAGDQSQLGNNANDIQSVSIKAVIEAS